jgi:hypothetical protein
MPYELPINDENWVTNCRCGRTIPEQDAPFCDECDCE